MSNHTINFYFRTHRIVGTLGAIANFFLALSLLFATSKTLAILKVDLDQLIWAKFSGGLIFIITCYYVPELLDLKKYRLNAWLSVFIRGSSALFYSLSVLFFLQQPGFLIIAMLDLCIGAASFILLYKLDDAETITYGNPLNGLELKHHNRRVYFFAAASALALLLLVYAYSVIPVYPKYIW